MHEVVRHGVELAAEAVARLCRPGDGTVPLRSAHPVARSSTRVHLHKLASSSVGHERLCERPEVHALCIEILAAPPTLREHYELAPRRPDVETTTPTGRRLRIVYPRVRRARRCEGPRAS